MNKDDLFNYLVATDTLDEFLGNEPIKIEELDRIKTKDGRTGTVLALWSNTTGLEVEFDDNAPETETIDVKDVVEIINDDE